MRIGFNIGSGQRPFTSTEDVTWINIDSQPKWNPDVVCSGSQLVDKAGFRIQDNTVDYVVLHHVLEHFGCGEGAGLVTEAYRVLKPGGSLLVFVPDMAALADRWFSDKISTQIYMTNVYGAYMGSEDDRHKWGYTESTLEEFLHTCAEWQHVFPPTYFPAGADIARDWWILELECVK
jgi:predicted SAM-dependent methyltransferase